MLSGSYSSFVIAAVMLIALAGENLHARAGSAPSLSPALAKFCVNAKSVKAGKAAKVCTAFGFDLGVNSRGREDLLQDIIRGFDEDVLVISTKENDDITRVGWSDVAIGYVNAIELYGVGKESNFLASLSSLIDGLKLSGSDECKLIIVVGGIGEDAAKLKKVETQINQLIKEALVLNKKTFSSSNIELAIVVSSSDESAPAQIQSLVENSGAKRTGAELATHIESSSPSSSKKELKVAEVTAMAACGSMPDTFSDALSKQLIVPGSAISAVELKGTVVSVADSLANEYRSALDTHANSNSLKGLSFRARSKLAGILQQPYRKSIDMLYADALSSYDALARRVPANSKLRSTLRSRASGVIQSFVANCKVQRDDYVSILAFTDEGLFAERLKKNANFGVEERSGFEFAADIQRLSTELYERCEERVRSLFLQGTYNPFVRSAPWAPTHINLNYLIDPRSVSTDLEYNQLYDKRDDGIALNRADPVHLPGVARSVFDPNAHPVPKDNNPWWKTLQEFYAYDEEEEEEA